MAYTAYVTATEYYALGYNSISTENLNKYLIKASRHVDALTFNRIVAQGFEKLTEYQKGIVQQVVCEQAEFLYENADAIDSIISSYSINGVSMQFGTGFNVIIEGGLPIESTVYTLLTQTGLCCRLAR